MEVYLDNSATTRIRPEVLKEIIDVYENNYGNPSSLHRKGLQIEKSAQLARKSVAKIINSKPEEVYFTAGGTESNNIAVFGHLSQLGVSKNIITTRIEHPSVYNVYQFFEKNMDVRYLDTDSTGKIDIEQLNKMMDENTLLVSIILVNSEIGTIQNIDEIINIVKKKNKRTKIHVDAVQAFGKIKIDANKTVFDTMSFSSHKIHGPKGTGGLYINPGCKLNPVMFGGSQEKGIRPGTENTPGIVGFGKACELVYDNFKEENEKLYKLRNQYALRLKEAIEDIKINSYLNQGGAPHILNISFKDIRGEVLVHYLEQHGIYVSTGSACSSKSKTDNRILKAIKLDQNYLQGTIRISLGYFNNLDEVEYTVAHIKQSVESIRDIMR